ncbi:dTMP kinase [bacterium CG17_big_fil_post_rev_8_21_14_2_50_64_8]|nr:MAG: dTMP kinase [bacterium CG17_big_fil_post_rev_8_21_14_2_50_64_8]
MNAGEASGLLITFEGPEGSGKTTLIEGITRRLVAAGEEPLLIREPGGTDIGERIREILLDPASEDMKPETELLLMVASRAQLVREKLRPALEAGMIVLCDRFADASVAYQGFGRGLGEKADKELNAFALDGITPDLTLLCMLPPEVGQARLEGRSTDRLDREAMEFHQRVYEGYRTMADGGEMRFKVIDAAAEPAQMLEEAIDQLKKLEHGLLNYL